MVVDFGRYLHQVVPVIMHEPEIEIVTYAYRDVYLNNNLDWSENTIQVDKKGQSHIHLLR